MEKMVGRKLVCKGRVSLCLLCIILLCTSSLAHGKKKPVKEPAPEWTHSSVPGYVISSAIGGDEQDAKERCFRNIQSEILNSVAVNISSTSTYSSQSVFEGDATSTRQAYQDEIKTVAARLPFLTGLTIANADVWMEQVDGGWRCYMKYPFSRSDQERLVEQFLAYDKEKSEQLDSLKKTLATFTNIDKISAYIAEVETLNTYFFDDTRKSEAEGLKRQFREAALRVAVTPVSNEPGRFVYRLTLDGRNMTTSLVPVTRCETLEHIDFKDGGDGLYSLVYSTQYCLPTDENNISMMYNFKYNKLKHIIHFNLSKQ